MNEEKIGSMRLFFAIALDDGIKQLLNNTLTHLKQYATEPVQWTILEKLHITLRFLGEVQADKTATVLTQVRKNIENMTPFDVSLGSVTTFPPRHPRMIALTVPLSLELAKLYQAIEQASVAAGFKPETRPFLPHITLGRIENLHAATLAKQLTHLPNHHCPAQTVRQITLFSSTPSDKSNIYSVVEQLQLGGVQ